MEGRKVKVYFHDGEKVVWRIGKLTAEDQFSITLDEKESISRSRIIRSEVVSNE